MFYSSRRLGVTSLEIFLFYSSRPGVRLEIFLFFFVLSVSCCFSCRFLVFLLVGFLFFFLSVSCFSSCRFLVFLLVGLFLEIFLFCLVFSACKRLPSLLLVEHWPTCPSTYLLTNSSQKHKPERLPSFTNKQREPF